MWSAERLAARRATIDATPALHRLRGRLTDLLTPLLDRPVYLPDRKALLSRDGGVCPTDGARLAFDPLAPYAHGCPRCGRVFERERDHLAWVWRYQIWLSERAVHLALLSALGGRPALADRAAGILDAYAARYREYPNRDNVLGPTRLFFSTYLESIWLSQVAIAAALLEGLNRPVPAPVAAMIEESAELVASFDEGFSNRQVWNDTALCAAGRLLGRADLREAGLDGPHGLRAQLSVGVTADGLWFEGENYHFFALRGFHLAGELCGGSDSDPLGGQRETVGRMFVAPLDTLLPDLTLPARGDAPFGVSVRQVRFAELWELGRACGAGSRVDAILAAIYGDDARAAADHGFLELAEQETNRAPGRVERWGLGWKALLWMPPDPPAPGQWHGGTRLLPDAGVAVLRPARGRYLAMECGGRPGGHGHPDVLHLTLFADRPLLTDMGTGSYVDATLHWYRSSLAHNVPMPAASGQYARAGRAVAIQQRDEWSWVQAAAHAFAGPGTGARRSVVCGPAWVVDVVDVDVPAGVAVDLATHPLDGVPRVPSDGRLALAPEADLAAYLVPRSGETVDVPEGPGPPDRWLAPGDPLRFVVRRARGPGRWVQVYELAPGAVTSVTLEGDAVSVHGPDGAATVLRVDEGRALVARPGVASIALTGTVSPREPVTSAWGGGAARRIACPTIVRRPDPRTWEHQLPDDAVHDLGPSDYRRSECVHDARFRARVATYARNRRLGFAVRVFKPDLCFRDRTAPDPRLDNEPSDIHSDGVQCYVMLDDWQGWLAVPVPGSSDVRVSPVRGLASAGARVEGKWCTMEGGYALVLEVDAGHALVEGEELLVNVVVNEMAPGRMRRSGQLALAGGGGWVYLRGDRESPATAAIAEVV
jgi:hypothetical protein